MDDGLDLTRFVLSYRIRQVTNTADAEDFDLRARWTFLYRRASAEAPGAAGAASDVDKNAITSLCAQL